MSEVVDLEVNSHSVDSRLLGKHLENSVGSVSGTGGFFESLAGGVDTTSGAGSTQGTKDFKVHSSVLQAVPFAPSADLSKYMLRAKPVPATMHLPNQLVVCCFLSCFQFVYCFLVCVLCVYIHVSHTAYRTYLRKHPLEK